MTAVRAHGPAPFVRDHAPGPSKPQAGGLTCGTKVSFAQGLASSDTTSSPCHRTWKPASAVASETMAFQSEGLRSAARS